MTIFDSNNKENWKGYGNQRIVKETIMHVMDEKTIRYDSVVKYKKAKKEWVRGIVKFVDRDSVKIMRSVGTQESFSATQIGEGLVEIIVEIY